MATKRPGPRPPVKLLREKTTWVQCESPTCLKWRLVDSSYVDLKESWFCQMNPDPAYGSCSVAQDHITQEHGLKFVYSPMPVGSLVLAESSSWPKWPAIVSPDPDSGEHVTLRSDGRVKTYHIEFLGNPHTRCWSPFRLVEPYHPINFKEVQLPKGTNKKSYAVAFEEATRLLHMECEDRLQMCHFMPDELLYDAQTLMTEIEDLMKQFKQGPPSSKTCSCGGAQQPESDDDGDLEEVGDIMDIESFRFVSSPCKQGLMTLIDADDTIIEGVRFVSTPSKQGLMRLSSQSRSGSNNDADVTIIDGVRFESFETSAGSSNTTAN